MSGVEQAGIYQITLYERKDLTFTYPSVSDIKTIESISNIGLTYQIINIQKSNLTIKPAISSNSRTFIEYTLEFYIYNIDSSNQNFVNDLRQSAYGWSTLIQFYSGDVKFIDAPLWYRESSTNNQVSNTFNPILKTIVNTNAKFLDVQIEVVQNFLKIDEDDFLIIDGLGSKLKIN